MWNELIGLDQQITLWINGSDNLWLDGFALSITSTMTWIPAALVLLYVIIRHGEMREILLTILALGLCILIADQTASGLFKPLVARPRPTHDPVLMTMVDVVNDYRGGQYGFFSSHAANTFGAAMFFTLVFRHAPTGLLLFCWASLSSYTRIYLGVHFPIDILCGALCGLVSGTLFWFVCQRICGRHATSSDYSTSLRTPTGYAKTSFSAISFAASLSVIYALIRAVVTVSML